MKLPHHRRNSTPTVRTMNYGTSSELEMEESSPVTASPKHNDGPLPPKEEKNYGSTVSGAVFNFTNSIVGAGAIGLGGAIASSGGLVATLSILFFAVFTKESFDTVISLSVHTEGAQGSYEQLGRVVYGNAGYHAVLVSKFLYSFGCLVAYIVIIKDNFATALWDLILLGGDNDATGIVSSILKRQDLVTWLASGSIVLPLCLLRDMTPLEKASVVKIFSVISILAIVIYLYVANPSDSVRVTGGTTFEHWFQVRPGILESLGTFVFTFVSQHNVHQVYASLRPDIRNPGTFERVSTWAVLLSTALSIALGLLVYMTFWETATSAIFALYPPLPIISIAKLLLCIMMMLTFPLPFFSCRELLILFIVGASEKRHEDRDSSESIANQREEEALLMSDTSVKRQSNKPDRQWLLPGQDKQLIRPYHVALTVILWGIPTFLAIAAPSLGDVLNLVGSATGTLIAFVLPALFSFRLRGYTPLAVFILVVGGVVGTVGTVYSTKKLIVDAMKP